MYRWFSHLLNYPNAVPWAAPVARKGQFCTDNEDCCVHNPPFIRLSGCNLDTDGEDDQHLFRQLRTALSMVTWTLLPLLITVSVFTSHQRDSFDDEYSSIFKNSFVITFCQFSLLYCTVLHITRTVVFLRNLSPEVGYIFNVKMHI